MIKQENPEKKFLRIIELVRAEVSGPWHPVTELVISNDLPLPTICFLFFLNSFFFSDLLP